MLFLHLKQFCSVSLEKFVGVQYFHTFLSFLTKASVQIVMETRIINLLTYFNFTCVTSSILPMVCNKLAFFNIQKQTKASIGTEL